MRNLPLSSRQPIIKQLLNVLQPKKTFLAPAPNHWLQAQSYLHLQRIKLNSLTICNGGHMFPVPTGNIQEDQRLLLLEKKITRSCMYVGKMRLHMQNGQERDCRQKRNGNLQHGVEDQESCIHGAIH